MKSRLTFVTPTYGRDLDRFCLLRESIERFDIEIPHIAIVQDEDIDIFRTISYNHNLTVLSTRDVLPPHIEKWRSKRSEPVPRKSHYGWLTQMLVKLSAPSFVQTESVICLDSDTFFIDHVADNDFHSPDGRLHLYELDETFNVESMRWWFDSARFLGISPRGKPLRQYIHMLVPFRIQILNDLQAFIEYRYDEHWADAMLKRTIESEYVTYALFTIYVLQSTHVLPISPELCLNYWPIVPWDRVELEFLSDLRESRAKAVAFQSSHGQSVDNYRSLVEMAWESSAERASSGH